MNSTSSCDSVWDLLSGYADGIATPAEIEIIDAHVLTCEGCAADLAFMRNTSLMLADVPELVPPAALRESILAATVNKQTWLERITKGIPRLGFAPRSLGYAGTLAAGMLVAYVMYSKGPEKLTPETDRGVTNIVNAPTESHSSPLISPLVNPSDPGSPVVARNPVQNRGQGAKRTREFSSHIVEVAMGPSRSVPIIKNPPSIARGPATRKPTAANTTHNKVLKDSGADVEMPTVESEPMGMKPAIMMEPVKGPTESGMNGGAGASVPTTTTASSAPREYHIQLSASGDSVNAGSVASLADLRSALRKSAETSITGFPLVRSNDRKEVRLDLLRGKF